jgi:hypothetical protein
VERRGELEQPRRPELAEVGGAEGNRDQGAEHQAEQDRHPVEEAAQEPVDQHDDQQGRRGQADVAHGAELGRVLRPERPADRHREQGHADHRDHGPGDDRREEPEQAGEERGHGEADQAGEDQRAVDGAQAVEPAVVGPADGEHGGDGRERGALHDRQPRAEPPQAEGLQQRGQAGHEQGGAEQVGDLLGGQLEGGADDQRDRDHAGVHAEHVLQAVDGHRPHGQQLVDRVHVGGSAFAAAVLPVSPSPQDHGLPPSRSAPATSPGRGRRPGPARGRRRGGR